MIDALAIGIGGIWPFAYFGMHWLLPRWRWFLYADQVHQNYYAMIAAAIFTATLMAAWAYLSGNLE